MRRTRPDAVQQVLMVVLLIVGLSLSLWLASIAGQGHVPRAMLLAAGIAILAAALLSTEAALLGLLIVAFTDGLIKGMDPTGYTVLAKDVFLIIALFRWGWLSLWRRQSPALRLPVTVPIALLALYVGAQILNTTTASLVVAVAGARSWLVWMPLAFITYDMVQSRRQLERIVLYVVVLGLLTSIYGIVQYNIGFAHLDQLGPGFEFYDRFGWEPGIVRATSTFVNPGAFGAAMAVVAIVAAASAGFLRSVPWRGVAIFSSAACMVGLAASASRAPLLGLVVGGVAVLVLLRRPRLVVATALITMLFVWQMNEFAAGAFERRFNPDYLSRDLVTVRVAQPLRVALSESLDRPLGAGVATGAGIGRGAGLLDGSAIMIRREAGAWVESEYGRALYELGIPGLVLFLWLLYRVVATTVRSYRRCRSTGYRLIAGAGTGLVVAVMAQMAVGSTLYLAPAGPIFWIFFALTAKLPVLEERELGRGAPDEPPASAARRESVAPQEARV